MERKRKVTGAERTAISKLRVKARAGTATAEEAAKVAEYEGAREGPRGSAPAAPPSTGSSRAASRKVSYTEEETAAEAAGTGAAAEAAASTAAAFMVREEGKRLDSILTIGIGALQKACDQYAAMVQVLIKRTESFETTNVKLLEAMSDHFVGRAELEAELLTEKAKTEAAAIKAAAAGDPDGFEGIAKQLLPFILPGIPGAVVNGAAGGTGKKSAK